MASPVLDIRDLSVDYLMDGGRVPALSGVSMSIHAHEVVGLVGESGSGKSTLSWAITGLLPSNGSVTGGEIVLSGRNLLELSSKEMRDVRGHQVALIFQDALTSLNPSFTIGTQMSDIQRANGVRSRADRRRQALESLRTVRLPSPETLFKRYPHELSGGMRQRVLIAMALVLEPSVLVADEPTASLDVTLEAQILALIRDLRSQVGSAIIFVSHDLGVVAQVADRVVVMYAGCVVEEGTPRTVLKYPRHPYTRVLVSGTPSYRHRHQGLARARGSAASAHGPVSSGCRFVDRCPYSDEVCRSTQPTLAAVGEVQVRCHLYDGQSGHPMSGGDIALPALGRGGTP